MPATLTLTGVDELLEALRTLGPDLTAAAGPLEAAIAEDAAGALRAAVPVVTGTLRRSIHVTRPTTAGSKVSAKVVVSAPYAGHVEFGTRYRPARPLFVPTIRRAREAFVAKVVARVRAEGLTVTGAP